MEYTKNVVYWGHPNGYFLNAQGQKRAHSFSPTNQKGHKGGGCYPVARETGSKTCHLLMALAFNGPRPTFTDKNGKPYVGICHHLIPDRLNYKPANLLCWLTREQHTEADRRQRALKKVVPNGDLTIFTYERLRQLQDPRTMSREQFESELAAIEAKHYEVSDPNELMRYEAEHPWEFDN